MFIRFVFVCMGLKVDRFYLRKYHFPNYIGCKRLILSFGLYHLPSMTSQRSSVWKWEKVPGKLRFLS